jgi:hypothetical protein
LQVLALLVGLVPFVMFPGFIVELLFGKAFLPAVPYVPFFSVFMCIYVLINFMVTFFLAINETSVVYFQIPAVILQVVLLNINTFNENIYKVIYTNIFVSVLLLASLFVNFSRLHRKGVIV